ncbi:MAG: DEAD/DEAH box helicase family protein, partial [Alphaproteobacteria bacterium]
MQTSLRDILEIYRNTTQTQRDKGTRFELFCKDFLKSDKRFEDQFSEVYLYAEWAEERGLSQQDVGVDLVAKLRDGSGYCAIQCKMYDENSKLQKTQINSFFTELGKKYFAQGLFIDTTINEWSENARKAFENQSKPVRRIGLNDLEDSNIDWSRYVPNQSMVSKAKKTPRPHQQEALNATKKGFEENNRGKLIMACGTGKTFTSLKIAEELAGQGKRVLFMVPSIALMSQTVTEWVIETGTPIQAFSVCSDTSVGKRKVSEDIADSEITDLTYPATTQPDRLAQKAMDIEDGHMQVVFCTYQSIQVVCDAQKKHGLPAFDLIICDEAHRTTGQIQEDGQQSNFTKIHDDNNVEGKKRLYMTATPRIYDAPSKKKADDGRIELCSMDDEALYGKVFYSLKFSDAVEMDLLTDYKVIVLAVNEAIVSQGLQHALSGVDGLNLDDTTKLIGCYKALTKTDLKDDLLIDEKPMKRAVTFCKNIAVSKALSKQFSDTADWYIQEINQDPKTALKCKARHVDGTFSAKERNRELSWLKEDLEPNECHILSNARCLSEGVDVPALDAIMFMHPRKSIIDVVQSVGRVMRRSAGKKLGYVILPIAVPPDVTPEEHLNKQENYQVVWQVLNALRSHDERLDADINKIDLGAIPQRFQILGIGYGGKEGGEKQGTSDAIQTQQLSLNLKFDELKAAIYAKLVQKCGTGSFWVDWANDIAKIAKTHITRLTDIVNIKGSDEEAAFNDFLEELQDDLNESVTKEDAIEMLAQHIITKPVFNALFADYDFAAHNPVSKALQKILTQIEGHNLDKENKSLQKFYRSVEKRAEGIDDIKAKQKIIVELYDKFFATAFKRTTEKLGIVYTPVEVVDFIIHSVEHILKTQFNSSLGHEDTHILDPFTGTGTFITRLMQSKLISKEELKDKFKNEIHANEIVLLAYYIAAINIEQVYHDIIGEYEEFGGICLTDTFALEEGDDMISRALVENSNRRTRQKQIPVKVIIGNPPYSAGQTSQNDNNQNVKYPLLDNRIEETYVANSNAASKKSTYDSYIRAIRWASDRIGNQGVIGFVTNAGFMETAGGDGIRKCLAKEFSNLYFFHLRGNARTSGELRRKEKDNVFGSGSRAPIVISILVKNPNQKQQGQIYYHDIGDYLSREEKLQKIKDYISIEG